MAINYLNSIDLNRNELQDAQLIRAQVENQPNNAAAGTGVEGQLYYDTTLDVLKVWAGGSWSAIGGGGVETLTTTDGTYIDLTPNSATTGNVTVTADISAVDGTAVAATRFLSKDNTWDVPAFPASDNYGHWVLDADGNGTTANIGPGDTADFVGGLKIGTDSTSGGILNITHDLQAQTDSTSAASPAAGATFTVVDSVTRDTTGHATGLNVKTITLPAATTVGDGQINGQTSGFGLSGSMDATANQSGNTTFTVASNATTAAAASTLMYRDGDGYSNVVTPASGDSTTKIATTAFVQSAVTGLLEFKSGFNATSGVIDDGSGNDLYTDVVIQVGDYYVVTVAGDFFGNTATPLTVGDSVIAQKAVPDPGLTAPVEGDFIVVQSDTDLATLTTVGIGNVNAGGAIDVAYSSGTATVSVEDSTASNKGAVIVAGSTGISVAYASGTATVTNTQNNSDNTYAETIADTDLTIDHGLNTSDVIVQLYDITTGETVFADVDRISATRIGVTFASTPTNSVRVLVQKIG